jgi:hypothetical protein
LSSCDDEQNSSPASPGDYEPEADVRKRGARYLPGQSARETLKI